MIGSRKAEFPYNHKTISVGNAVFMWLRSHTLIMFLPKDLIEIKNLFVYLEVDFSKVRNQSWVVINNPTPVELRKIGWIGGTGGRKYFNTPATNNIASVRYDFSGELDKFGLHDGRPQEVDGTKSLRIDFGCGNDDNNPNVMGNIRVWKVDIVYTTREIR